MLGGTVARKRHRRVSYILREEQGRFRPFPRPDPPLRPLARNRAEWRTVLVCRHRGGVESLALNRRGELLFSAGRFPRHPLKTLCSISLSSPHLSHQRRRSEAPSAKPGPCRDGTARCWSTSSSRDRCERVYDAHTDWVNDVVLLGDEATLVTGRSSFP